MGKTYNKNNKDNTVNLLDLFFYLLGYWFWFVLCVVICVGYQYYKYSKTPFVYRSDATVIIKDPNNTKSTVRMDNYNNLINKNKYTKQKVSNQEKRC